MVRHAMGPSADHDQAYDRTRGIDPPTVPLQRVAAGAGSVPVRRPANRLGAMTFGVVVAGALMTIFPRTAALGLLLCLLAIVPAIVAYLRLRSGRATNRRSAVGALIGAPTFLVVGLVVLGATAPPPVATSGAAALSTTVAAAAAPASPAPPAARRPPPTSPLRRRRTRQTGMSPLRQQTRRGSRLNRLAWGACHPLPPRRSASSRKRDRSRRRTGRRHPWRRPVTRRPTM